MAKRGQITLFIILGIMLLLVFGFLIYVNNSIPQQNTRAELEQRGLEVQRYVNSCFEQKLSEAEGLGLKDQLTSAQEAYIKDQLRQCSDFSAFESTGTIIQKGEIDAKISLSNQVFSSTVTFPIVLTKKGERVSFSSFNSYIRRTSTTQITGEQKTLLSGDKKAELKIPEATYATLDGQPISEIGLTVLDKNFDGLENGAVAQGVVYEGTPDRTQFTSPVELTLWYNLKEIPEDSESSLAIAYYDTEKDMWVGLESQVDTINKKITAKVSHFTKFAIVLSCGDKTLPETLNLGWLYKEPCYEENNGISGTTENNCPKWNFKNNDGKIIESKDVEKEVKQQTADSAIFAPAGNTVKKAGEQGALPQYGKPKGDCKLSAWNKDKPEEQTYGYSSIKDAGGTAQIEFVVKPAGNSCIPAKQSINLELNCDDSCTAKLNGESMKGGRQSGRAFMFSSDFSKLKKTGEINTIEIDVENQQQECSSAAGKLSIPGKTGNLKECEPGKPLYKNCMCGQISYLEKYDADKLNQILASTTYELATEEQLKGAKIGQEYYCDNGRITMQASTSPEPAKEQNKPVSNIFGKAYGDDKVGGCCKLEDMSLDTTKFPRIYPDLKQEGDASCEVLVCVNNKANPQYSWIYTGREKKGDKFLAADDKDNKCADKKDKPGNLAYKNQFLKVGCGLNVPVPRGDTGEVKVPSQAPPPFNPPTLIACNKDTYSDSAKNTQCSLDKKTLQKCIQKTEKGATSYQWEMAVDCSKQGLTCLDSTKTCGSGITSCNEDGKKGEGEDCDGQDFGEKKCSDIPGKSGGALACKNCKIDSSGCVDTNACISDSENFRECKDSCGTQATNSNLKCTTKKSCCVTRLIGIQNECMENNKYYNEGDKICHQETGQITTVYTDQTVTPIPSTDIHYYTNKKCVGIRGWWLFLQWGGIEKYGWEEQSDRCEGCCKCSYTYTSAPDRNKECSYITSNKKDTDNEIISMSGQQSCEAACALKARSVESKYLNCFIMTNADFDNTNPSKCSKVT